jgi:hypothetical protein
VADFDSSLTAEIYRAILLLGLENLQRYRTAERFDYLEIEIDHLHNIPKYMADATLIGHGYYFCNERPYYLERIVDIPVINADFLIAQYQPHWDALRAALRPHADAINALDWYTEF